jgi:hypothetical protein
MQQTTKSLPEITRNEEATYEVSAPFLRSLERLKRFLWYGTVYQALQVIQSVEGDLEVAVATSGDGTARKLLKAVEEFHTYIEWNQGFIPNYGERYRHGEGISTGFVESPVNQVVSKRMVKKQQIISARGIPLEHRSYWDLMQKYGQVAARNRCTTVSEAPLRRVEDALKVADRVAEDVQEEHAWQAGAAYGHSGIAFRGGLAPGGSHSARESPSHGCPASA